jgi:pimeloyl-CoA synthetase
MAVITLEVPSKAQMGYGLGKAIQYGVEYEVLNESQVELSSGDEMKLARMMVAFQGKLISATNHKNVRVEHPKHEA